MELSDALRVLQAGRRSQGGAGVRSGAEENQTSPHNIHRGTAGRTGGAVSAESVSRCEHEGETCTAHSPERRKSRSKTAAAFGPDEPLVVTVGCHIMKRLSNTSTFISHYRFGLKTEERSGDVRKDFPWLWEIQKTNCLTEILNK